MPLLNFAIFSYRCFVETDRSKTIYEAFGAIDLQHRAYVELRPRDPRFPRARLVLESGASLADAETKAAGINAGGSIELMSLQLGE